MEEEVSSGVDVVGTSADVIVGVMD
jgi:hypothetical protein